MLGFIVFGWPKREKFVGSASPGFCDHCQNQSMWQYIKTRRWFSLFFIPLIPLGRAEHWLACDICGASIEMDKETAKEAKEMVGKTERRSDGELGEDRYFEDVEVFGDIVTEENHVQPDERKVSLQKRDESEAERREVPESR